MTVVEDAAEILICASRAMVYRYFTMSPICRGEETATDSEIFSYVDSEQRMALPSESFAFSGAVHFSTSASAQVFCPPRDVYLIFYDSVGVSM